MTSSPRPRHQLLRRALELFALAGFAITQPLLAVFGRSASSFIFRDASSWDIIFFAIVVTVVPTVLLVAVELLVGLASERAARILHVGFVAVLVGLIAIQVAKRTFGLEGAAAVVLAVVAAGLVAAAYVRWETLHTFLQYASPAPILFLALFLVTSEVSALIFPGPVSAATLGSAKDPPTVVMVVFDEWPTASFVDGTGNVDARYFPNLARLAGMSTWYRNSTSVTTSTWYAVPAIVSGRYPKSDQTPIAASYPQNLFTFLGSKYDVKAYESVTRLCPSSVCKNTTTSGASGLGALLSDAGDTYGKMVGPSKDRSEVTAGFEEADAGEQVSDGDATHGKKKTQLQTAIQHRPERYQAFLDSFHRNEPPTLHYVHILVPHVPYRFLPSGAGYEPPVKDPGRNDDLWTDQQWPPMLAHERMLLQAAYADRLVGALLAKLDSTGLLDRSVVVATADHGIAFTPGEPVRGLKDSPPVPQSLYSQLLWQPLFVKAAGQRTGTTSDANVMSIDILPTIAKLTGFTLPWKVDGVVAGSRAGPTKVFQKAASDDSGIRLGPPQPFDGTQGYADMLAQNVDAVTLAGDPKFRLWRMDPVGALVGRKVSDLTVGAPAPTGVIQSLKPYRNVNLSRQIPVLFTGITSQDATIAVAVNGTIGGVSPTFAEGGLPHVYAAIAPDFLFRNGANDIAFYTVTGPESAPVLHPMGVLEG